MATKMNCCSLAGFADINVVGSLASSFVSIVEMEVGSGVAKRDVDVDIDVVVDVVVVNNEKGIEIIRSAGRSWSLC